MRKKWDSRDFAHFNSNSAAALLQINSGQHPKNWRQLLSLVGCITDIDAHNIEALGEQELLFMQLGKMQE